MAAKTEGVLPPVPRSLSVPSRESAVSRQSGSPRLTVAGLLLAGIVIAAFGLRVWAVGERAMHLDESTVAWFAWQLLTGHGYSYDPVYHGPFQHEVLALIFLLFGSSQTSARMLAVVLGTGLVVLPWFIRDYLGKATALMACFLLAVSPSFVYFARFERDDTYMEFFTFLMVIFAMRFLRDRRPWQIYSATATFALAFATKESIYVVAFIFGTYAVIYLAGRFIGRTGAGHRLAKASGALPMPLLIALLVVLTLALIITPVSELYVPVPAVAWVLIALGVAAGAVATAATSESSSQSLAPWKQMWRRQWISGLTIALAIIVLMYSTFGTNLNGLWDQAHPFFNNGHTCPFPLAFNLDACRKDIIGGLFYWLSQHKVARGGQPWYYYFLIYGLYEQLAIVFSVIAIGRTLADRGLALGNRTLRMFFTYWGVLAFIVYSWAGEKFPWLGIHPLLPITVLAAFGLTDVIATAWSRTRDPSRSNAHRTPWRVVSRTVLLAGIGLIVIELHNTYELNFVNGANPVEMMVYVQSAPDTVTDANRIGVLSNRATKGTTLPVTIDSTDAWPFAWYLRNMSNVGYPTGAQSVKPPYSKNPIVILDQTDAETLPVPASLRTQYTRTLRRLDWWFPEDYKTWTWQSFGQKVLNPNSWRAIWNWETVRTPFGPRDGTLYYLYVKKGYFAPF
jgi:uncharacterized protein (TIGR03663 family)